MRTKAFLAMAALLVLSACGPIIGSMMTAGNGVKEFRVVSGNLATLRPGAKVAVLGPFATTPASFEICRGEEAAAFTASFNQTGLFPAELAMTNRLAKPAPRITDWQGQSPAAVQKAMGLAAPPDLLMSATILHRELTAAPAQGVIMKVGYRLEFLELTSGKTTTVEISLQQMYQDAVPVSVKELAKNLGRR
jgi:hypothetical protein